MDKKTLEFPKSIMTGVAGDFARLFGKYTESAEEFYFMSFLTIMGNIASNFITLDSELLPQPRINTVLLGESGEARKSFSADTTIRFFMDATEHFNICRGVGSAEGLAKILNEKERTVLFYDELKQLASKCRIDGSVLLPTLTTLFENNYYENNTKTSSVKIKNAHLSIIACSTIPTFEEVWNSSMSDIGLTNRLLLIPGSSENLFAIPKKVPQMEKYVIKTELLDRLKTAHKIREYKISDNASEVYDDWYKNMERSDYSRRLDTYALRMMLLFAMNDKKELIDSETVLKATYFCDWQLKVRKELTPIDADNATAKMEEKIRRQLLKGNMTKRELQQKTNANRVGTWYLETAIGNLVKSHEIAYQKIEKVYTLKKDDAVSKPVVNTTTYEF